MNQKLDPHSLQSRSEYLLQIMPRIGRSLQRELGARHAECHQKLTPGQITVMHHLIEHGPSTMRVLSCAYGVTMPTMTGIVSRLVALKLVKRAQLPSDRRVVHIELTQAGLKQFQHIYQENLDFTKQLLSSLDSIEQDKLIEAFETIERLLAKPDR